LNWSIWRTRLLFAALLFFGSEIILWTNLGNGERPQVTSAPLSALFETTSSETRPEILFASADDARTPLDWLITLPGYVALAALLLELAARYRARSIFEAMALTGIYGIANGLLLNPTTALVDVPRTLVTRAMGGHALVGLAMLALFLFIQRVGAQRGRQATTLYAALIFAALVVGIFWGAWARWTPVDLWARAETPLPTMLIAAGCAWTLVVALTIRRPNRAPPAPKAQGDNEPLADMAAAFRMSATSPPTMSRGGAPSARLTRGEWAACLMMLAALAVLRFAQGVIDGFSAAAVPLLIAYCLGVLYFRQRKKGISFVEGDSPAGGALRTTLRLAGAGIVFLAASLIGYDLLRTPELIGTASDPVAIMAVVFTAYGLVWLPCVSLVLGARAFIKQARGFQL